MKIIGRHTGKSNGRNYELRDYGTYLSIVMPAIGDEPCNHVVRTGQRRYVMEKWNRMTKPSNLPGNKIYNPIIGV